MMKAGTEVPSILNGLVPLVLFVATGHRPPASKFRHLIVQLARLIDRACSFLKQLAADRFSNKARLRFGFQGRA